MAIPQFRPVPAPPPLPPPPIPTIKPQVPREPLAAFIADFERGRDSLRTAPAERIHAVLAQLELAATMVFGREAVLAARRIAYESRGWRLLTSMKIKGQMETQMRNKGMTDEQILQEYLDIRIEMLRVLLAEHGQPVEIRELPSDSPLPTE
jgi:hypothetical protein